VPIPIIFDENDEPILDEELISNCIDKIAEFGSNV
jgi:hypothetical protein